MLEEKTGLDWAPDQDPFSQHGIPNLPIDGVPLHQLGDFAEMGIGLSWWPSSICINLLEFVHVSTQLPWWGSIAVVTLMLRVALFPLLLKTSRNQAILNYHRDDVEKQKEKLSKARKKGSQVEMKTLMQSQWELYRTWGYKPFLGLIGLLQIPIFFGMFRMCNICAKLPVPGWDTGGAFWFTDLTAADPYFVLPIVSGATTAFTIFVCHNEGVY